MQRSVESLVTVRRDLSWPITGNECCNVFTSFNLEQMKMKIAFIVRSWDCLRRRLGVYELGSLELLI